MISISQIHGAVEGKPAARFAVGVEQDVFESFHD